MKRVLTPFYIILFFCLPITAEFASSQKILNLSLEDAKIMVLENNRDIEIQRQNINFAEGNVEKEKGAFDPVFNLSSLYSDSQSPVASALIQSGSLREKEFNIESSISGRLSTGTFYDLYNFSVSRRVSDSPVQSLSPSLSTSLGFSIGQELLKNFGRDTNNAKLFVARKNLEQTVVQLERTVSGVLFDIERDYWGLVASMQNLELEKKALELAEDLERRNTVEVEVGTLPSVAITQARAEVALRKVALINAENSLERAKDKLKNALVLPYNMDIVTTEEPKTYRESNINGSSSIAGLPASHESLALETAFKNRTELAEALHDIEKGKRLKKFYSNQRLPSLKVGALFRLQGLGGKENTDRLSFGGSTSSIPGDFTGQSKGFQTLIDRDYPGWSVVGVLSYPLLNRSAKGDYIQTVADLNRRLINYKKIKERIEFEVRDAFREVRNSLKKIDASTKAVELAEEVVRNDEERLKVGIATTREVLESQRDLIDAQTARIEAITQYNISIAALEKAKGTLLLKNNIVIRDGNFKGDYSIKTSK